MQRRPLTEDLGPDVAHVWRAPLDAGDEGLAAFEETLSAEERARAAGFSLENPRRAFVASRGLLRSLLPRYAGGTPAEQRIVVDVSGKPRLDGPGGRGRVQFNVSHSEGIWACAVALRREVGLDVETVSAERARSGIAEIFFSPAEASALAALPPEERAAAFFRCWTRKEAYLKARGSGIAASLDSFEVSLAPGEPARLKATRPDPAEASRWSLHDIDFGPGFAGALAAEGPLAEVRLRSLKPSPYGGTPPGRPH